MNIQKSYAPVLVTAAMVLLLGISFNPQSSSAQNIIATPVADKSASAQNTSPATGSNVSTSSAQNTSPATGSNVSTSSAQNMSFANSITHPFQGISVKIFNVVDFSSFRKEWHLIDYYVSHGYDIKAILPRENTGGHVTSFTVVLQTKG
jgi:hypothetical protein